MSSLTYRPEIDGLRALAVLPVVLFHMGAPFLAGGYAGVDVFFVISGYLISLIIIKESYNSEFSFKKFWMRRIRRIMPALLVMLITTSIVGYFVLYAPDVRNLGHQGFATALSFANIEFWLSSGSYWGADAKSSPLLHTWSLSVEEQFYLFFPVFLILLLKKIKYKATFITLVLACSISFLLFIYGVYSHPSAAFYLLLTRAWELGTGGLLALLTYHHSGSIKYNNQLSLLGLFMVVFSYVFIGDQEGISYYLFVVVVGAALIIATSANPYNFVHKLLACRIMVLIGVASYSIYLWHWPVLILLKAAFPLDDGLHIAFYALPLIIFFSSFSYYYVEKKLRYSKQFVVYIGLLFLVSLTLSQMLSNKHGIENTDQFSRTSWLGDSYNVAPPTNNLSEKAKEAGQIRMEGIHRPENKVDKNLYKEGGVIRLYGEAEPEVVVFGDSHALMWAATLDDIFKELRVSVSFYAADGTPTFFNIPVKKQKHTLFFSSEEKYTFDKKRLYFLHKWKPKLVVISSRWSNQSIAQAKDLMDEISKLGAHILLVEDPPVLYFGDKNTPQYLSYLKMKPTSEKQYVPVSRVDKFHQGNDLVHELTKLYDNCDYLPVEKFYMTQGEAWVLDKGDVLYIDDDHLSYKGSLMIREQMIKKITSLLAK